MLPKISVIVVTYNQASLISRTINSILVQKSWIYEVLIFDDHSSDNNWEIITEYEREYPQLIKAYQNSRNLGIFANIENTWNKPTGDLVFYIAGDDEFCNGLFEQTVNLINTHKIDCYTDCVCLYFDYKTIWPNGKSKVFSNRLLQKNLDPVSLKLRRLINNRTTGFSRKVLDSFFPVRKDIGIYADSIIDIQLQLFATKNYYFPFVGSIYYAGIGISKSTEKKEHYKSMLIAYEELGKKLKLSRKDNNYLLYRKSRVNALISPSYRQIRKMVFYFITSYDHKIGIINSKVIQFILELFYIIFKTITQKLRNG